MNSPWKVALITLVSLIFIESSFGQSMEGIKIIQTSLSKKSLILDRGTLEGLAIGQKAKLYFKDLSEGVSKPKFIYVAEGEIIKVHSNYSFWFLRKIRNYRLLKNNGELVMLRKTMDPRREYRGRHTQKVLGPGQSKEASVFQDEVGVPADLIFEDDGYFKSDEIIDTKPSKLQDFETRSYSRWLRSGTKEWDDKYKQDLPSFHINPQSNEETISRIKKRQEEFVYQSTTDNAVKKINDDKRGLKGFYKDSFHDNQTGIQEGIDIENIYQKSITDRNEEKKISPHIREKLHREGVTFSADMSQEELRRFLIKSGIEEEKRMQERAAGERAGNDLIFRYNSGMISNTTDEDDNFRGRDYSIVIGYEWQLYQTAEAMDRFTFELNLEQGISHYDLGGINGRFSESALAGFLNFYFWNAPYKLGSYMPFVGLGVKRGQAEGFSPNLSKDYSYQLMALPSFRLGIKYRFKPGDTIDEDFKFGMAVSFLFTSEKVRLNTTNIVEDDIFSVMNYTNNKFGVGFSFYF